MSVFSRRSGFTLIELLVVIGIIGILSGVMLTTFGGATDSAMASRCMTNMRNLAMAAHNYAMKEAYFPNAGSYVYRTENGVQEHKGWISWIHPGFKTPFVEDSRGRYPRHSSATTAWRPILGYEQGDASGQAKSSYAITNGALWAHSGMSFDSYVCPLHQKACRPYKIVPMWSYVMNSYFGCSTPSYAIRGWVRRSFSGLSSTESEIPLGADRVLLFAEVPFWKIEKTKGNIQNSITKSDLLGDTAAFDCTLRYNDKSGDTTEAIGFNHKSGKRYVAHVAFADGHVAALSLPPDMDEGRVKELTTWLCQGDEVSFNGTRYERVNKADTKTR